MTPLQDDELKKMLRNLDGQLRLKPLHHEQLRDRILIESKMTGKMKRERKPQPRRMRIGLAVVAALLLLVGTSPFYSPAVASLVVRILPLEITPSESASANPLHTKIMQIAEDSGYTVSSVGTTPDPFTIHLAFTKGDASLSTMEQAVEPAIKQFLYEQGIDQYQLDVSLAEEPEYHSFDKLNRLMDKIDPIIRDAFIKYGYPDLADQAPYSLKSGLFSYTVELDMPDHVEEAEKIKEFVAEAIESEDLDISKVEMRYYTTEHRSQDNRWAMILSDIYDAMAGKAAYSTTGLSYKVEDEVTQAKIKTALTEQPDPQLLADIESAILAYLDTKEIKDSIQNDEYRIQLLSEEENVLLEVTNTKN